MSRGEGEEAEPGAAGPGRFAQGVKAALTSAAIGLALAGPMLSLPGSAGAAGKRTVGEISASGLVFKVSCVHKIYIHTSKYTYADGVTKPAELLL